MIPAWASGRRGCSALSPRSAVADLPRQPLARRRRRVARYQLLPVCGSAPASAGGPPPSSTCSCSAWARRSRRRSSRATRTHEEGCRVATIADSPAAAAAVTLLPRAQRRAPHVFVVAAPPIARRQAAFAPGPGVPAGTSSRRCARTGCSTPPPPRSSSRRRPSRMPCTRRAGAAPGGAGREGRRRSAVVPVRVGDASQGHATSLFVCTAVYTPRGERDMLALGGYICGARGRRVHVHMEVDRRRIAEGPRPGRMLQARHTQGEERSRVV